MKDYTKKTEQDGRIEHLNLWQRVALRFLEVKNKKILDIGCGSGSFLHAVKPQAKEVCGIDPNQNNILELQKYNIPNKKGFLEEFQDSLQESFDLAVCFEVIEHLYDHKSLFLAARKTLKVGGFFLVSTPNAFHFLRAKDFLIHQEHRDSLMDPTKNENPEHIRLWSYGMLYRAFISAGFTRVQGFGALRFLNKDILLKNKFLVKYFAQNLIFVGTK